MKPLVCEMCNSNDLIKIDGVFVCQFCGCKYSVEEARKLMGTVAVEGINTYDQELNRGATFYKQGEKAKAMEVFDALIDKYPDRVDAYKRLIRVLTNSYFLTDSRFEDLHEADTYYLSIPNMNYTESAKVNELNEKMRIISPDSNKEYQKNLRYIELMKAFEQSCYGKNEIINATAIVNEPKEEFVKLAETTPEKPLIAIGIIMLIGVFMGFSHNFKLGIIGVLIIIACIYFGRVYIDKWIIKRNAVKKVRQYLETENESNQKINNIKLNYQNVLREVRGDNQANN